MPIDTVLDVGAGNGKMIDYFTEIGRKITAVDLYPTRKDIQKMDILDNKIQSNSYDLVYSAHLIEHLHDPEKFVYELMRISKKYICVVAPLPGKRFWDQPDHVRPYTQETLKRVFHLNKWIKCFEMNLPGAEPIAVLLFDKADSRISTLPSYLKKN
ncbi:MAG: class I SAM-dependent methyltransferase [Candidatus Diapherotrites archaeon]